MASFEGIEKSASPRFFLDFLEGIREYLPTRLHEEPELRLNQLDDEGLEVEHANPDADRYARVKK